MAVIFKNRKWLANVKRLQFVLFWTILLISLATQALYSYFTYYSYNRKSREQLELQVSSEAHILADRIIANHFAITNSRDNLSVEIDQLANVMDGRILVVDAAYKIIKDTYTIEQDRYLISGDVMRIVSGEETVRKLWTEDYLEMVVPVIDADKHVQGAIMMTVSTQNLKGTNEYITRQGRTLTAIFILVAVLLAFVLSHFMSRGLNVLNEKLKYMSNGHLDEPMQIKSFTEIEDMSQTIDQLMSKMQVLEESRQEFVSNVSHELKTPITSMKVLADSLLLQEDAPTEMYREFLVDIVEEIERENTIINDLLTLVKTDKKSAALAVEPVNMNALMELLLKRLKPLAAKRNIEIEYESVREVVAEIDEVKLSLAFSNLIENAIKYNEDNGWVKVSLDADHKFFYVKVEDSGVGIPEDCQEHIFERFYRVDKARTRETGGTGLGLAITRNSILLHKGAIKVYSEPGKGTTFTVRIPLNYIA